MYEAQREKADYVWREAPAQTVTSIVRAGAEKFGAKTFLDFSGESHSYEETYQDVRRLAAGLWDLGVGKGQTVATVLDNSYDAVLAWFAINFLGAISVPVNTAYKGEFLRHQIADCGAEIVIAESAYIARLQDISEGLPQVRCVVERGAGSDLSAVSGKKIVPLSACFGEAAAAPEIEIKPSDLCMLIYTAGTTGPSKGCMISHNYACNLARQGTRTRQPEDIVWTALPLFHFNATAGATLGTALIGATLCIYPRFSLSKFWPEIERSKATVASLLGSMIPLIAQAPDTEISKRCYGQLRRVNGAPFPAELQEIWMKRFGVKERPGSSAYGLTESSLLTSLAPGVPAKPGSSGMRNDDFDVRIFDENDNEVAPNVAGEIVCRPRKPHVMFEGYWGRPADSYKLMRNMWFHTGDIGKFDEEGYFYFVDRKKDYLRRRGENISSFEMETAFRAHPGIEDVAVHAVFSDVGEDDVKVTAVLKAGATLSEEELCVWAVDRVPYFAVPRYIEFRIELPRNPVGRVLKYQLRDEGCTASTWDREKSSLKFERR